MKYDVTIGIPVYQSETYLSRSLDSVMAQTYPSVEFLLVDDGCTDGSMSIILEYQNTHPRGKAIRIISHEHNKGLLQPAIELLMRLLVSIFILWMQMM